MTRQLWVVRAGVDNQIAKEVAEKGAVAIGWEEIGDLSRFRSREDLKQAYAKIYTDDSPGRAAIQCGQLWRFAKDMNPGDWVITAIKSRRELMFGELEGDYKFDPTFAKGYPHTRRVRWLKTVSRDQISVPFRNSTGGILTVFSVGDWLPEAEAIIKGQKTAPVEETITVPEASLYEDTRAKSEELFSDALDKLGPYQVQDLVAGALMGLGFRAKSVPPGADGGVDVIAHRDALGFEGPIIKAQVKHRKGEVGVGDIRDFLGTLKAGENGIFVSTGGFNQKAKNAADGADKKLKLYDRTDFIKLLLEVYEKMSPEYQSLIPLKKVYIPV